MKCPKCGARNVRVCMTKSTDDGVNIRRRICLGCDHRWYTGQEPEYVVQLGRDFKFYGRGSGEKVLLLQEKAA